MKHQMVYTQQAEQLTSSEAPPRPLPSDLVGLLAGISTFLLICAFFAVAACIAMCKLRAANSRIQRELSRRADNQAQRHSTKIQTDQGVVILLSLEHASINSTKNGIQNGAYSNANVDVESSVKAIKHEIASQHFLKNGFHHIIDDEIPAKQKITKVLSTPPLLVRDANMKEREEKSNKNADILELPENSMRRSRSLKTEARRANKEIQISSTATNKQIRGCKIAVSPSGNDPANVVDLQNLNGEMLIPVPSVISVKSEGALLD